MSNHTPGMWKLQGKPQSNKSHFNVIGTELGGRFIIARCPFVPGWIEDEAEAEANARLIAAAPDLLEALQNIIGMHERCSANGNPVLSTHWEGMAKQAINKATQLDNQK